MRDAAAVTASDLIIDAWRAGRTIVPFLGAGVSLAAGFPTISRLTSHLAKIDYAIKEGIYSDRYPAVSDGLETALAKYKDRPSDFITDFGWPDIGQLNADIWRWLSRRTVAGTHHRDQEILVQNVLRRRLAHSESSLAKFLETHWTSDKAMPRLSGDWSSMLDYLSEGKLGLINSLFASLDRRRSPTRAHVFLTFLVQLMGIPLILSLNFDTLLEQALSRQGITPRIFDVHRDADLPHPHLVRQHFSLVKLHGSAYGLRFGERIQYSLGDDARHSICSYTPDDALLVVVGFSGWERRMMQVIEAFAARSGTTGQLQVLWLTTRPINESDGSYLSLLIRDLRDRDLARAFDWKVISDANMFLPGLYFRIASALPASRDKYDALVARLMSRTSVTRPSPTLSGMALPGLILIRDDEQISPPSVTQRLPSSWTSLVASEIVSIHGRDRDTIWIDVGTHHTVEGVVLDILRQIRTLDPGAAIAFSERQLLNGYPAP